MKTLPVTPGDPKMRLLGRMDPDTLPPALDWTGSGVEVCFRGTALWAELEATELSPVFWMIVLADGCPVTRFPVEPGCRFYPLLLGMEAEKSRTVTLMKETQCMPDSSDATVLLRTLRMEGELLDLPKRDLKIEFIGDSLTSGEGALAPRDNDEWITPWFTARGNYACVACQQLNAEMRLLSQSGWGVVWDWEHTERNNMTDTYDLTVGALRGEKAEKRGCRKPWDFTRWQPDIVCIRLLTNDCGGVSQTGLQPADRETIIGGCVTLIRKIRTGNPTAKIVWILPGSAYHPEFAKEAIERCEAEGIDALYSFALPDYTPEDYGARQHPNAAWNVRAGHLLAEYLRSVL